MVNDDITPPTEYRSLARSESQKHLSEGPAPDSTKKRVLPDAARSIVD